MVIQELMAVESPKYMRVGEGIAFPIDTTNYGGSPTDPSAAAFDMENSAADVTGTVLTGDATIDGDNANKIILPVFSSAVVGKFRIIVTFTNARYTPAKPALDVVVVA